MSEVQSVAALEAAVAAQKQKAEEEKKRLLALAHKEKPQADETDPYAEMDSLEIARKIGTGEITDPKALTAYFAKSETEEIAIVKTALGKYPEDKAFMEQKIQQIKAKYTGLTEGGAGAQAAFSHEHARALEANPDPEAHAQANGWFAIAGRLAFAELVPTPAAATPPESAPAPEPAPTPSAAPTGE